MNLSVATVFYSRSNGEYRMLFVQMNDMAGVDSHLFFRKSFSVRHYFELLEVIAQ